MTKRNYTKFLLVFFASFFSILLISSCGSSSSTDNDSWFSSWGASQNILEFPTALNNSTARMIVRPTISGNAIRVKIENTHGLAPVVFGSAYIGVAGTGA